MQRRRLAAFVLLSPLLLAVQQCPRVEVPVFAALVDDSAVLARGTVPAAHDVSTAEVWIDGLDLLAALGLAPPFQDAGGVVVLGSDLLTVTQFRFERDLDGGVPVGPWRVSLEIAGLPEGPHAFELRVETTEGELVRGGTRFSVVAPFTLEAATVASAGRYWLESAGAEGWLFTATLGQPLAAPPVPLSGGGELRSGFVEVSEARIAGGTP
jgi:hypothetical protein